MRFALLVEYEGTAFHGSQYQAELRTVQGELEVALERIYGGHVRARMASRTDAGVHAAWQVAVFDADDRLDPATLRRALNFHAPEDISVRAVEVVRDSFEPRRKAVSREYVYSLNDGPVPSALRRRTELHVPQRLDVEQMRQAAACLVGSHDFVSFAGPATEAGAVTVRRVLESEVTRDGDSVRFRVVGNAFLHQQVRRMTSALAQVGRGKLSLADVRELVENPRRGAVRKALEPKGLCLTRIDYGPDGPFSSNAAYN